MIKKLPIFITLFVTLFCIGCSEVKNYEIFMGPATIIAENETPVDVMRRIYLEFVELKKPVLKKIKFHRKKRRLSFSEFSFHWVTLPPYYEYVLTDEANNFISKNTVDEITASLMPIVMHPEYGGEVVVLLTGILTHWTFHNNEWSKHVSIISSATSKYLYSAGYKSPSDRGKWNYEYSKEFNIYHPGYLNLYGAREGVNKSYYPDNSLHSQLRQLRTDSFYYAYGAKPLNKPTRFRDANSFDEWLVKNPLPPDSDLTKHRDIIEKFGEDFVVLGLYPEEINPSFIYYILDLKKYWPIIYGKGARIKKGSTSRFRKEVSERRLEYEKEYKQEFNRIIFELTMSAYNKS